MKKLLLMSMAFFACMSAKAETVDGTTLIINGSSDISVNKPAGNYTTIKLVGDFTDGWDGKWLDHDNDSKNGITTIDMSEAYFQTATKKQTCSVTWDDNNSNRIASVTVSPSWGFTGFHSLTTIVWPDPDKTNDSPLAGIPSYAIKLSDIQTIKFPYYVEYIGDHAVDMSSDSKALKSIVFEQNPDPTKDAAHNCYCGFQAFSNTKGLSNVVIETLGSVYCANNSFDHAVTYGHGDVHRDLARLSFPDEKADYYVNQNHPLDEATAASDALFQPWLVAHYASAGDVGNGFYEFVSNGSSHHNGNEGDVVLKTFSHSTIDYVVPKGAKAYIVSSVSGSGSGESKTFSLTLKRVNVIPHGTGVILFGGTNSSNPEGTERYLDMMAVKYIKGREEVPANTEGAYQEDGKWYKNIPGDPYTSETEGEFHNLLVATSVRDDADATITVAPFELGSDGKVAWRSFGFGRYSKTEGAKAGVEDFYGFFRTKPGTAPKNKAFLRLSAEDFDRASGAEVIVTPDDDYKLEYEYGTTTPLGEQALKDALLWYYMKNNTLTEITWKGKWGERPSDLALANYYGEPFEDIETLILPASMVEIEDNAPVYNLQGMEVTNPTKGVYIKNGKKFVVK